MFFFQRKAAFGNACAQCRPFVAQGLFVRRAAFGADQNKRAMVRFGFFVVVAMIVALMLRVAAQNIAVDRRHFVQNALLRPKIKGAVGRRRRNHALALLLHLRQNIVGFNHAALLQNDIEYLLAQSGYLQTLSACLFDNFLFEICFHKFPVYAVLTPGAECFVLMS